MAPAVIFAKLGTTRAESKALRDAGLSAADLPDIPSGAIEDLTDGAVSAERAEYLAALASLLRGGHLYPSQSRDLLRVGVRRWEDLAKCSADELWCRVVDESPLTQTFIHRELVRIVGAARGRPRPRNDDASEGVAYSSLVYWRHRYGPTAPLPSLTNRRLRTPLAKTDTSIYETHVSDAGLPARPVTAKQVTTHPALPRRLVGHFRWEGREGAFFRLHELATGATVEVHDAEQPTPGCYRVLEVYWGFAPQPLPADADLVLATPPHRRFADQLAPLGVPVPPAPDYPTLGTIKVTWPDPIQVIAVAQRIG